MSSSLCQVSFPQRPFTGSEIETKACSFSEADAGSHWGPHGLRDGETSFPEDLTEA